MAIYNDSNKKVKSVFANINGQKKEIQSIWGNKNGVPTILFRNRPVSIWPTGTWTQISDLLTRHYNGEINIANYFNIGDERTIHLSAMDAYSNLDNESHSAQDVTLVIIDFNKDTLSTPVNGITKAAMTVHLKKCLVNSGIIDSKYKTYENSYRSFEASWSGCARRAWCNNVFKNSLPAEISSEVKRVKKTSYCVSYTGNYSSYTNAEGSYEYLVGDYCFLLSPYEGYNKYAVTNDGGDIRYEYYADSAKRSKDKRYWFRKPMWSQSGSTITTGWNDHPGGMFYYNTDGIAPAFCL